MSAQFEAPQGGLSGGIGVQPIDPNDPTTTPNIIRTSNPLELKVVWQLDGAAAPYVGGT